MKSPEVCSAHSAPHELSQYMTAVNEEIEIIPHHHMGPLLLADYV